MTEKKKMFNKAEYDLQYEREHCYKFGGKFYEKSDHDVIEKLKSVPNRTDYIRQLVRKDIEKEK